MDAQQLVERINLRHGTRYTLHGRYASGENQGAYALTDEHGTAYVLKWNERPPWLERLRLAQRITAHLRALDVPVPQYVLADTGPDNLTYWIQTALPGAPPQRLGR